MKERCLYVGCFQNVEHLRRPLRIGAIVKRDRDLMLAARALMIERGKLRELYILRREISFIVHRQAAPTVRTSLIHRNDFPFADICDRIGSF